MTNAGVSKIPRGQTPERRAYMQRYCATHPKRDRRAYKAAYDAANKEKIIAYREATKASRKVQRAAYYRANRERILREVKLYTEANYDKVLAYHAEHYATNRDKIKANVAAYRKANPQRKQYHENTRRVRKRNNGGSHTFEELRAKFDALGNVCFYCGNGGPLAIDHDIPISRGGSDDIENILPACKTCNSRKSALTAKEFIAREARRRAGGGDASKER